jgi:L-rhamnose isomerase
MWRVCVWGEDDFGMEIDLYARNQAKNIFEKIEDYTTIAQLKALGFVRA